MRGHHYSHYWFILTINEKHYPYWMMLLSGYCHDSNYVLIMLSNNGFDKPIMIIIIIIVITTTLIITIILIMII